MKTLILAVENLDLVYPNPANEVVFINMSNAARVEAYDFTGKKVHDSSNTHQVVTSNWEEGLYLFRLLDAKGNMIGTKKVFVRK